MFTVSLGAQKYWATVGIIKWRAAQDGSELQEQQFRLIQARLSRSFGGRVHHASTTTHQFFEPG